MSNCSDRASCGRRILIFIVLLVADDSYSDQRLKDFEVMGCDSIAIILDKEGLQKHLNGKDKEAIQDFDAALRNSPKCASAFNNRGLAKCNLNDLTGCLADHNRAIELQPEYFVFYNNRGRAKAMLCDFDGAMSDYDIALKDHPFFPEALGNKAILLMATFHDQEAKTLLEQAIALRPSLKSSLESQMKRSERLRYKPCR